MLNFSYKKVKIQIFILVGLVRGQEDSSKFIEVLILIQRIYIKEMMNCSLFELLSFLFKCLC